MKELKRTIQIILIAFAMFAAKVSSAQSISPYIFGQNAWMPDTIGNINNCPDPPCVFGGKLHQQWGNIGASKATAIRFGGIAVDKNMPTHYQYIKMIDSVRSKGMEPMIQVPYYKGRYTAQQAASIVAYVNGTMGRNVKYWIIGNEPDLSYAYTTAAQVAAYIKPFASAMKAADPSILTVGPECAWFNQAIMDGLTTPNGPSDITGQDQNGRYYIDIISFHSYSFNGSQSTREDLINKLNSAGGFQDNLMYLNGRINTCNAAHNRTGLNALRSAVTEANIDWQNPGTDNVSGLGANSFIGGQFIADMYGVAMKNNVSMLNMWSVVEGNNVQLNIGYIDPVTGNKKPSYYHFKMVAEHFKGTFISGSGNQAKVKSFGSHNSQNTAVLIMNQEQSTPFKFTVRLNSAAVTGTNALKININAGLATEYSDNIPAQASMILVFNSNGALIKKVEYSLATHALNNLPPTVTEFSGLVTGQSENDEEVNLKGFHINLYPNPANSKFTVELDRRNPQEKKFEIEMFDLMGRLIYTKVTTFLDRKQELDLSGNSLAEAVYIVRVREKEDKDNVRAEKIILFK